MNSFIFVSLKPRKYHTIVLLLCVLLFPLKAQTSKLYPDTLNAQRLLWTSGVTATAYTVSMIGLYQLWYADYPQSSFHLFNDNDEWMQMDKAGHAFSSYQLGRLGYESLRFCGVKDKSAALYGGASSLLFMTTIEVFDGFSSEWGFSSGDMLANLAGVSLFTAQQLWWQEQRMTLKFSYSPTSFPAYRPDLLGETALQSLLKDYNGQTYWISVNPASFFRDDTFMPDWLNIAFGYGADGMLGASSNPSDYNGIALSGYERRRQYYLSLDVDMTRIHTDSEFLRLMFKALNCLKIPLPTLEFSQQGIKGYWLYY